MLKTLAHLAHLPFDPCWVDMTEVDSPWIVHVEINTGECRHRHKSPLAWPQAFVPGLPQMS